MAAKGSSLSPLAGEASQIWDKSQNYLRVMIRDFVTEVRVGLHPWEQHPERPTRIVINIEMFAPLTADLGTEQAAGIVDYDHVRNALLAWPERAHTLLLETLLSDIVKLCFQNERVEACRVSILKPDIFNDAAAVGVEAYIRRPERADVVSSSRAQP